MSDYRVRISIRNERLLSAIEEAGYSSARQCSIANGYKDYLIGNLVNGSIKPLDSKTGKPTKFCKEVLEILGKSIEDCFTPRQLQGFKKNSYQVKVDEKELKQLVSEHKNQGDTLLESDLDKKISEVLSTRLTPRQEKIVRMHFGLGKYKGHTITELAKYYNLSTSRVGQILDKAIRKLQHVSSASLLLSTGFYEKFTKVDVKPVEIDKAELYLQ
jgi:RNA polymerase sigma factor (sigma-70 family)|tara:strand:+ start:1751 stop:2395 length:645 start_codon:yes stop_codon:yes gene_type:complete